MSKLQTVFELTVYILSGRMPHKDYRHEYDEDRYLALPVSKFSENHYDAVVTFVFPVYKEVPQKFVKHLKDKL